MERQYCVTLFTAAGESKKAVIFSSPGATVHPELLFSAQSNNQKAKTMILSIMETLYYWELIRRFPRSWRPDAVQTAHMATLIAVTKFDVLRSRQCKFETFACQMIKAELDKLYNTCVLFVNLPQKVYREYKTAKTDNVTVLRNGIRVHDIDMLLALVKPSAELKKNFMET